MEITMIKKILHRIILGTLCFGCCLACASCSQESITPPVSATGNGQVKILYKIAGTSLSRATEDGWGDEDNDGTDEWNENKINRIDLFVFDKNGKCVHHIVEENINVTDAQQEDSYTDFKKDGTLTELTYAEVAANKNNYTYYMVANCNLDDIVEGQSSLDDLKVRTTPSLIFNQHPNFFAMDGKLEASEVVTAVNETTKTATLQFELARAAVKIRVSVNDESSKSIIQKCQFQLFNYVEEGTSVLSEAEAYGETDRRKSMNALNQYSEMLSFKGTQVVFYSYPNDWFDEGRVKEYEDDEGNKNGNWVIDNYVSEIPIIDNKQTYILLKAPFNNNEYYYKVPVNYTIYKNNDAISFTDEELKEIHDLYRMQRNHIYDITVTIDREGGITEGEAKQPSLQYNVADYDEEEIDVPTFS